MTLFTKPLACLVLAGITLILAGDIGASDNSDYVQIAKSRLAELDEIDMRESWFYTVTTHTDDEVLVARNDPTQKGSKRRTLISVNGEPPSAERLKKFEERQASREQEDDDEDDTLSSMVDLSTLVFDEVSDGQVILSYTPVLDGLEEEAHKLAGTLKLNADSHLVEALGLKNIDKISPAFSVSLSKFRMQFLFKTVDGETLMSRMTTSIEGKAGFLKKFKENTEVVFSGYQRKP